MGEVYLAQDTSELGRAVALNIVPAEVAKDRDRLQRFTQEARTVSNLNHPNILTVYEFGQTDSGSFIATEYIDGVTLREHLSERRLKLIDILDLAVQIVAALNAAHEAGVTHRELPSFRRRWTVQTAYSSRSRHWRMLLPSPENGSRRRNSWLN